MNAVIRTELDALLERVRECRLAPRGTDRNSVAYDCLRMFEDLAERYKEECVMRDRYKRQSNSWRDEALRLSDELARTVAEKRKEQAENTRLRETLHSLGVST